MNATMSAWPTVVYDRCEANYAMVPGIAEFWSSVTGLAIVAAGLLPLLTSEYSDDLLDVVNAFITLNGVAATLAHGTLLRVVGQADALSINLGVLLFVKALVMAHSPRMTQQAGRRTVRVRHMRPPAVGLFARLARRLCR